MTVSNYDKYPIIEVPEGEETAWRGWHAIVARLRAHVEQGAGSVVAFECYPGVFHDEIGDAVRTRWPDAELIDMTGSWAAMGTPDHDAPAKERR